MARESGIVKANRGRFNKGVIGLTEMLGVEDLYPGRGPYPFEDSFGMKLACMLLMQSTRALMRPPFSIR
jgi:hypothetical protein